MKKIKNLILGLLASCLLTLTLPKTVYGQKNYPDRIVYSGDTGIFLTEYQERLVLEKFQWKEIYKSDAVTMYFVNQLLEEKVRNSEAAYDLVLKSYEKCEEDNLKLIRKNSDLTNQNNTLTDKNKELKKKNTKKTLIIIGETASILFLSYLLIAH